MNYLHTIDRIIDNNRRIMHSPMLQFVLWSVLTKTHNNCLSN